MHFLSQSFRLQYPMSCFALTLVLSIVLSMTSLPRLTFVKAKLPAFQSRTHQLNNIGVTPKIAPPHKSPIAFTRRHYQPLRSANVSFIAMGKPSPHQSRPMQMSQSTSSHTETAAETTTQLYDEHQFAAFKNAIEEVVAKRNVIRDFRKNEKDLEIVKQHLLDNGRKLPYWDVHQFLPIKASTEASETRKKTEYTKERLQERRQTYLDHTGLTSQQHRLATVLLAHVGEHCAKTSQTKPLYVAWEKILEAGMTPLSRILSTYLYALSLESDVDNTDRDVASEVAMFHDALYEPTEKTITLLVKGLVARGDAAGAEALLDGIEDGPLGDLRHRTTSPILQLYCKKGEVGSALRLYQRMRTTSRVKMDAATYAEFIAAIAENGYFKSTSAPIDGAEEMGYIPAYGQGLLDTLISEMAEDILDISEVSATVLHNGFAKGYEECEWDSIKPVSSLCSSDQLVANRVEVDRKTGKCPATEVTLRLIVLEESQRLHVHDTLLEMAKVKSIEYTTRLAAKGRIAKDIAEQAELATETLKEFSDWLK